MKNYFTAGLTGATAPGAFVARVVIGVGVGGTVVGGHTSAPDEIRGTSITGGEKKILGAGDAVHIPAKVPHQMLVANGKKVTYFVVKVEEK